MKWKVWICAALGILGALILFDVGSHLLASDTDAPASPQVAKRPDAPFAVGEKAPDFTLPDSKGKPHQLSDLVQRDTLLCFTCGCANCIDLQSLTALMLERLRERAPDVISVTTMPTDREETYFRDTRLKQRLLYERKEGPIMRQYGGHPCPRVYRLSSDRTITWVGSSPAQSRELRRIGLELAAQLGFTPEQTMSLQPAQPSSP
ncbi:MAG: redoxin domain-containing protein [Actinomycetota bacterium]